MVSGNPKMMPLAELVEDMDFYPRHAVDSTHVSALVLALEAGEKLPPIVVDKKSKRITDGWHRARAYRRFLGPDGTISVEVVPYKNDADMKFDAARRNAAHGRKLDAVDRTRCVMMLKAVGFSDIRIASALCIPEGRVSKLSIRVASAPKGSSQLMPGTSSISLKQSVSHLAGTRLTKSQAETHAMLPGTPFILLAKQLHAALSEGMMDMTDDRLVEQLVALRDLLVENLK